ncbi:hypothetical protein I8751_10915 [Nostocaceae cyanobacterium CENA357]|uniref:Uncharacterized protein n=1 Tax=Atlanticothrix silvestris CENA357 TaxID=1725252 RepID=A0A8J7HH03_9CYAN|nr:hypothetical protein [Atlanticothrix silvestris CENA357]
MPRSFILNLLIVPAVRSIFAVTKSTSILISTIQETAIALWRNLKAIA